MLEPRLVDQLSLLGIPPDQMPRVANLIDASIEARKFAAAAELLHRIALRLDRDSIHGRALARALGFVVLQPLASAAADFCVSKQYLHRLQTELEARLGELRYCRPASLAADHGSFPEIASTEETRHPSLFEREPEAETG
jgi:hypothetical protein